ncbi:hypothetical protein L2E82_10533 [Cichorium intybus]|uniref:Uncharacterized protein n=1 Tax=Cichorium intybus TaxID=13427 RepID=A0ACB9GAB5_CICIN|nr:hypothetical protein L2E82_10533 [Cichorium intybus]
MKHLHKHRIPFAPASNSVRKNVEVKVYSQKGWKEYFSVILGSDQVKSGKPSPETCKLCKLSYDDSLKLLFGHSAHK